MPTIAPIEYTIAAGSNKALVIASEEDQNNPALVKALDDLISAHEGRDVDIVFVAPPPPPPPPAPQSRSQSQPQSPSPSPSPVTTPTTPATTPTTPATTPTTPATTPTTPATTPTTPATTPTTPATTPTTPATTPTTPATTPTTPTSETNGYSPTDYTLHVIPAGATSYSTTDIPEANEQQASDYLKDPANAAFAQSLANDPGSIAALANGTMNGQNMKIGVAKYLLNHPDKVASLLPAAGTPTTAAGTPTTPVTTPTTPATTPTTPATTPTTPATTPTTPATTPTPSTTPGDSMNASMNEHTALDTLLTAPGVFPDDGKGDLTYSRLWDIAKGPENGGVSTGTRDQNAQLAALWMLNHPSELANLDADHNGFYSKTEIKTAMDAQPANGGTSSRDEAMFKQYTDAKQFDTFADAAGELSLYVNAQPGIEKGTNWTVKDLVDIALNSPNMDYRNAARKMLSDPHGISLMMGNSQRFHPKESFHNASQWK